MTVSFLQDDWRPALPPSLHDASPSVGEVKACPQKDCGNRPTSHTPGWAAEFAELRGVRQQWLDDLCAVEGRPDFFAAMGERAAARERLEGGLA